MICLEKTLEGSILDIGGGGEGIIGRLYGRQVTAIDRLQEELDEAPDVCEKLLMDATDLRFGDRRFDHVTFFYTLMYMDRGDQKKALEQAAQVLKTGGQVHIWDCEITSAWPEPFCVELDIALPEERIHTTYGVVKGEGQSRASILALCQGTGLRSMVHSENGGNFFMCFEKRGKDCV